MSGRQNSNRIWRRLEALATILNILSCHRRLLRRRSIHGNQWLPRTGRRGKTAGGRARKHSGGWRPSAWLYGSAYAMQSKRSGLYINHQYMSMCNDSQAHLWRLLSKEAADCQLSAAAGLEKLI